MSAVISLPQFERDAAGAYEAINAQILNAFALIAGAKARLMLTPEGNRDVSTIALLELAEDEICQMAQVQRLAKLAGVTDEQISEITYHGG